MGDKFKIEGEKALSRTTIFGFGKQQKYEDAGAAFLKAANAYKLAKDWNEAAEMFIKAARCQLETDSRTDACNSYTEAGSCLSKTANPRLAIDQYLAAIEIYRESNRFSPMARFYKEIAELLEKERAFSEAIEYYMKAADANEADNKPLGVNQCMLKVATLASQEDDFIRAAPIFESIGRTSLESKLGAYSAKTYFFQAVLCYLAAGDTVAASNKIDEYKSLDYSFPASRECPFLEKLIEAINSFNSDDFSQACAEYDRVTPLDPWKTSILVKIKRHIPGSSGDDVDLT